MQDETPHELSEVIDRIDEAGDDGDDDSEVSVGEVLESLGSRSFGPALLVPALIVVSPLSGVVGLPSLMALIIALVAGQLVLGRKQIWLPRFLLNRSVSQKRLDKVTDFLMPAARVVDRIVTARLTVMADPPADRLLAAVVIVLCLMVPPLEMIPFINSVTNAAIAVFGLAIVARDGLLAIVALLLTAAVAWYGLPAVWHFVT